MTSKKYGQLETPKVSITKEEKERVRNTVTMGGRGSGKISTIRKVLKFLKDHETVGRGRGIRG